MSRPPYRQDDDGVVVVIGSGAGGAVLAHELARAGIRVVLLEAGRMIEPAEFRNDELYAIGQQVWMDPRTTSGSWEVARLAPALPALSVKAVGGTTVHWGGLSFRMQPHEFKARTHYGVIDGAALADWPLADGELDPWYDRAEARLGVTGTHGIPRLPVSNHFKVLWNGAKRIGYTRVDNDRHAINSRPRDGRPACLQLGFCTSGCKSMAKWSASYTEIPAALATGRLELRPNAMALRIEHGDDGRVRSVVYADAEGRHHEQRARLVCVAANAVETPRLLLNSASARFPQGLANGSGLVGRHFMRHINALVFGMFERPVHMERGPVAGGVVYDEARLDVGRGFAGGYLMQAAHAGLPAFAAGVYPGAWGADFTRWIEAYPRLAAVWANGEDLPVASNAITLDANVRDRHGLPVAHLHIDDQPNDTAMRRHFFAQAHALLGAAGAKEFLQCPSAFPAAHFMGSCRMSAAPATGVVDTFGRSHEVPNLFVSDGSQMVTAGAENPTLTIVALALRQADHIRGLLARRDHGL